VLEDFVVLEDFTVLALVLTALRVLERVAFGRAAEVVALRVRVEVGFVVMS